MNFEMEVTNILKMNAYEPIDEEKVPVIKNCLGWEGLQPIKTFIQEEKRIMQNSKRCLLSIKQQI